MKAQLAKKQLIDEAALIAANRRLGREYLLSLHGWTVEEYFGWAPEDRICEYFEGTVTVASPASTVHQRLVKFLTRLLDAHVEASDLGSVFNGPATTRVVDAYLEPDVFFIRKENEAGILETHVDCAPDFVIEVVSTSTRSRDLRVKLAKYQEAEVSEYWAVDSQRREVNVWVREGSGYAQRNVRTGRLHSVAVPGFAVEVDWLWRRPLPSVTAVQRLQP